MLVTGGKAMMIGLDSDSAMTGHGCGCKHYMHSGGFRNERVVEVEREMDIKIGGGPET